MSWILRKSALSFAGVAALALVLGACAQRSELAGTPVPGLIGTTELDAGAHVTGLAVADNGDVWLATTNYGNGPSGAIRVQANGAVKRFPRIESFNRVAIDSAGSAWFTVGAGSAGQQPKIVRIERTGRVRDFALPPEGNFQGITIGSDGAPWFADAATGEIWRISSDGSLTHYSSATSDADELVDDTKGDLWFTETNGNQIGRLHTADGTLKEFRIPTLASRPAGIALGADGNIWFCESAADKIGRIPPAGTIAEFRIPTSGAWPVGIAPARDGALWFTELTTGKIGRITATGTITEYVAPGGGQPGPIARAADGSLWFVSNGKQGAPGLSTSGGRLAHFSPKRT